MSEVAQPIRPFWGLTGFFFGIVAVALALVVVNGFFDPPSKSTATVIGEFAAEVRNSAKTALTDGPSPAPAAETTPLNNRDIAMNIVPVLAGVAAFCGAVGLFRHERKSLPLLAIGAGGAAVVMQFAMWLALLICGVILIGSILRSIDGIFSFSIFDWFSG